MIKSKSMIISFPKFSIAKNFSVNLKTVKLYYGFANGTCYDINIIQDLNTEYILHTDIWIDIFCFNRDFLDISDKDDEVLTSDNQLSEFIKRMEDGQVVCKYCQYFTIVIEKVDEANFNYRVTYTFVGTHT